MSNDFKIYILIDPFTAHVRYVGQTIKRLKVRLTAHTCEKSNNKKNQWIRSILKHKAKPEIFLLELCLSQEEADDAEIFWIAYFNQ